MTPAAIIRQAALEGVTMALSPTGVLKAKGPKTVVSRWLPAIREHKDGIVAALQDAADDTSITSFRWLIHFRDRNPMEVTFSPVVDQAGALAAYPDAVEAEPIPEPQQAAPTGAEAAKSCHSCTHVARPGLGNLYCGSRDDLPLAYGPNHPLRRLPEDGGASCNYWTGPKYEETRDGDL